MPSLAIASATHQPNSNSRAADAACKHTQPFQPPLHVLQDINKFPFEVIKKWLPSHMRSRNPGSEDSLDLQIETNKGARELRMRCADAQTVNLIITQLRDTVVVSGKPDLRGAQCARTCVWGGGGVWGQADSHQWHEARPAHPCSTCTPHHTHTHTHTHAPLQEIMSSMDKQQRSPERASGGGAGPSSSRRLPPPEAPDSPAHVASSPQQPPEVRRPTGETGNGYGTTTLRSSPQAPATAAATTQAGPMRAGTEEITSQQEAGGRLYPNPAAPTQPAPQPAAQPVLLQPAPGPRGAHTSAPQTTTDTTAEALALAASVPGAVPVQVLGTLPASAAAPGGIAVLSQAPPPPARKQTEEGLEAFEVTPRVPSYSPGYQNTAFNPASTAAAAAAGPHGSFTYYAAPVVPQQMGRWVVRARMRARACPAPWGGGGLEFGASPFPLLPKRGHTGVLGACIHTQSHTHAGMPK